MIFWEEVECVTGFPLKSCPPAVFTQKWQRHQGGLTLLSGVYVASAQRTPGFSCSRSDNLCFPSSCVWLVAKLWSSKQLEVKVKESCQMFWRPRMAHRGRFSNITPPGTMFDSQCFNICLRLTSRPCSDSANWKRHVVVSKRSSWENGRKSVKEREPLELWGKKREEREAPRKYARLFWVRVEHGSQVWTCLMTWWWFGSS